MKRLAFPMVLVLLVASGCTSNEEKIRKVMDKQLVECRAAEGPFFDVKLFDDETSEILKAACEEEPTDIKQTDEFHGVGKTGPYDWLLTTDKETGVWILTSVTWEPMEDARSALAGKEPSVEQREEAEEALLKVQEVYPDHPWVRMTRVENALALREETRKKDKENPLGLGDAKAIYEENLKWARENDKGAAAQMQLAKVRFYQDHKAKIQTAIDSLGGQDEWLEAAIRDMRKQGDDEGAAEYEADLEKRREERPAQRAELYERLGKLFDATCGAVSALNPADIEDADLKELAEATKSGIDCSPEARPKNPDEEAEE